ncbi:MAG: adenylosuccinate synthase [Verrucomicrobiota bacterium]
MNTVLVGVQWGDEGKGKVIDVLTESHDVVIRSQGGNNAGHTIIIGGKKYVLHLLPTGLLRRGKRAIIGNGCVVDPISLVKEIKTLRKKKISVEKRLYLSDRAHVVLPLHCHLDGERENAAKGKKIGTTRRGIGPTYQDKINRVGLRMHELIDGTDLEKKIRARVSEANRLCRALGWKTTSATQMIRECKSAARFLKPYICDTTDLIHKYDSQGKHLLFEGAQGTYLDIDFGTYPFVTSSNTTSGGACTGSGLPPTRVTQVIGTLKAYTTRVGEGPFPTESDKIGDMLHDMGREFGATTGRARRCGWFDAVMTRYACRLSGVTELALTNLDGLDSLDSIQVCVAYRLDGKRMNVPPAGAEALSRCQPIYRKFKGWNTDTSKCTRYRDLPEPARAYLKAISELSGVPLGLISVGPRRDQTFFAPGK